MYTSKAPPTHQQIQQALVDVGDKEPSLVGSKEWIGSFEVSTCLNHLLGVGTLSSSFPPPFSLPSISPLCSLIIMRTYSCEHQHTHTVQTLYMCTYNIPYRSSVRFTIAAVVQRWQM